MGPNVISLNPKGKPTLRVVYRNALADSYSATVVTGSYDRACALTMVGFLSAAVIALRLAGDEVVATLFEETAQGLQENWVRFEAEIPMLVEAIDAA